MPIDPSQVQWDSVDPSAVQWDDEKKQRHTVMSVLDRFKMGMIDPIQGGAQLLTKALPDSVVNAGNRANNWIADNLGLVARLPEGGVDQQTRERETDYQQRKPEGFDWARLAGNVASPVNLAMGAGAAQASTLPLRMGAGAATGAAAASMTPVGDGDFWAEKGQQAAIGGVMGGAVPAAVAGMSRMISPRASVNPDMAALKAAGVHPTIGQTLGGMSNRVEEKAISLPIVGDAIASARNRATGELNRAVANRALEPIGAKVPDGLQGRELVAAVQSKLSDAYETLLPKLTVRADKTFNQEVSSLRGMVANGSIDPNAAKTFQRILQNDVLGKFKGQQALTGQTMKAVESDLGQKIAQLGGSTDADARLVADALREVQSSLRGLVQRNNPQFADELTAINKGWANFKRLERAASSVGAEDGMFSAAQLQNAVKALDRSKDKGKFARGQAFMQ
ncbi:MAG: hypothetical protein IPJ42_15955, partial [Betaproteobacteria bacterium]|nr:hypothetical protein [Betaproteobacteria bacterium]